MKRLFLVLLTSVLLAYHIPVVAQNTKENADFKLAINLYNDGLYDLAAEQLKQFIAGYPNTTQGVDAKFYLGLAQLKLKEYDDARLSFQTFALTYQDNPKAPDAWWNVGESYVAVKNYREAALAFERVKVFHPKSKSAADALVQASKYFTIAGERDDARRVLRSVVQEYAGSAAVLIARTRLGQMYFEDGNLDLAQAELKRVVEGDPSPDAKAQALLILGNISQSLGRTGQAQKEYQEIITKYEKSSAAQGAYLNLGKLQSSKGQYAEAVENFRKTLGEKGLVDSSYVREALIEAGNAYASLKEYTGAVRNYNLFIATFPSDTLLADVLWKSAVVNAKAKNYKRSNELCSQLLKAERSEPLRRKALGRTALNAVEQKNFTQAVQQYESFLEQYPDDASTPDVLFRIGTIAEQDLHDLRKAATAYEQLISRYSHSTLADDALAGAARCYEQLKDFGRALQSYRQLVSQYPASDLRAESEHRINTIETFEAKDKDTGLEKLASLLGDVVAERDKLGLSFRLGETYFNDLKNYEAAAEQFTNAIKSGLKDKRLADALFLRAKSYEYLTAKNVEYRAKAIESYGAFVASFPDDRRREETVTAEFYLRATSLSATHAAYNSALTAFPEFSRTDTLMLRLGMAQMEAESTRAALGTFGTLVDRFPSSRSAEEAGFRHFDLLQKNSLTDSASAVGFRYVSAHPHSKHTAGVMELVADMLSRQGKHSRALELYRRLTEDFAYTTSGQRARRKLADALVADDNPGDAAPLYVELLEEQNSSPLNGETMDATLYLALGNAFHLAGKPVEARKNLLQFLAVQPTGESAARAYNLLGLIYQKEGSIDVATGYFRQAGAIAPAASSTREVADLLFKSANYNDALKQYKQLSASAKTDADRQYYDSQVIICKLRGNELESAGKDINTFIAKYKKADDQLAAFELEKGNYYYRKEDYVNARKAFELVADKYDETASAPSALYWIGKVLESTNKPGEALKQYERVLKEYSGSAILPRVYVALGNIYYNQEKWDDAVQNYRRVVDDPGADPELLAFAMNNLIETYDAAGIYDAALSLTRKYLELYPNNDDSFDKRIKIGVLYQRLGYNDQSALHLQALLDEAGSDLEGEIRYYIAEANYGKGDYQQAILDFLKVPYLVTKKGKIDWTANSLYMAGQSYEKMGRYEQAVTMYQQIIDRKGIDETFKSAARKEIDRVKTVLQKSPN